MLQLISAIVGGIVPSLVGDIVKASSSTAGVNVAPRGATTNMLSLVVGALMAGIGSAGFGVDAIHTVTTLAGVAVAILSAVNHMGVIGASNANTEVLIEQLLTQIANYQPPVVAAPGDGNATPTG